MVELLNLVWDELYELEFDAGLRDLAGGSFGSRKRIPCTSPGKTCIAAPFMISIHRVTRVIRKDYPRDEFLELEQAEIERLRSLPPEAEIRVKMSGGTAHQNL